MSALLLAIVFIGAVVVAVGYARVTREKRLVHRNDVYSYRAKPLPMTYAEAEFFVALDQAVNERYYVFPQVHLSALLDYRVKGQDWRYAFRHINGKSVDFVLCDRETLRPTYAIELDDYTHERPDRRERDAEVERMLDEAAIPLVRFRTNKVSAETIIQGLHDAKLRYENA